MPGLCSRILGLLRSRSGMFWSLKNAVVGEEASAAGGALAAQPVGWTRHGSGVKSAPFPAIISRRLNGALKDQKGLNRTSRAPGRLRGHPAARN